MFLQEKIVIIKCEYDFIKTILKLWHNLHWASHEHKNSLKRHEPLIQLSYPFFVSKNSMSLVSDQNEIKQWWILNGEYKLLEFFWFGETCLRLKIKACFCCQLNDESKSTKCKFRLSKFYSYVEKTKETKNFVYLGMFWSGCRYMSQPLVIVPYEKRVKLTNLCENYELWDTTKTKNFKVMH